MKPTAESLTPAECWRHLGHRGIGRIGFDAGSGLRIHPLNYTSDGSSVYVRTSEKSELARFARLFAGGGVVTFEVDQLDPTQGERWSVLVAARVVDAGSEGPHDPALNPSPAPQGHRAWWVRLQPRQVTGRRLVDEVEAPDSPGA